MPIRKALESIAREIASGNLDKAKAHFAGENADLELLEVYIKCVKAERALVDAVAKMFPDRQNDYGGYIRVWGRIFTTPFDVSRVTFIANSASCDISGPIGIGFDFKQVEGKWKVWSLTFAPNKTEDHTKALTTYASKIESISQDVGKGKHMNFEEVHEAQEAAVPVLR